MSYRRILAEWTAADEAIIFISIAIEQHVPIFEPIFQISRPIRFRIDIRISSGIEPDMAALGIFTTKAAI